MPTGINTNNDSIVTALNNKVDLDLNNSSGILHTKNGGTGRDNGVANDVAINSDDSDLASNRGLFKAIIYDKVDFNTLTKQGLYAIAYADNPNGPGFSCRLVVIEGNLTLTQIALSVDGTKHKVRGRNSSGEWEDWIFVLTSFNVTDGVLFDSLTGKLSVDDSVVRTTGNQTISGTKTFTNAPNIDVAFPVIRMRQTDLTKGDIPKIIQYNEMWFGDKDSTTTDNIYGIVGNSVNTNEVRTYLRVYKNIADSSFNYSIGVAYPNEGDPYAFCPSTRSTPNDTDIVTVDYLNKKIKELQDQITTLQQQLASN